VVDKSERVFRYQQATVAQAQQMIASMGLAGPHELSPAMLLRRVDHVRTATYAELYEWLTPGELLAEPPRDWAQDWAAASPDTFARL
jgi:hypothetical protein